MVPAHFTTMGRWCGNGAKSHLKKYIYYIYLMEAAARKKNFIILAMVLLVATAAVIYRQFFYIDPTIPIGGELTFNNYCSDETIDSVIISISLYPAPAGPANKKMESKFALKDSSYSFRVDKNKQQFWSVDKVTRKDGSPLCVDSCKFKRPTGPDERPFRCKVLGLPARREKIFKDIPVKLSCDCLKFGG